mgnify:FL=1
MTLSPWAAGHDHHGQGLSAGPLQACVMRLKLFSLDERLILGRLVRLMACDRSGVQANLQRLLPDAQLLPCVIPTRVPAQETSDFGFRVDGARS